MLGYILGKLDTADAIVSEAYGIAEEISSKLEVGITTELYDGFLDGLREDAFGNILYEKVDANGAKQTTLNYSSRPVRHRGGDNNAQSKVEEIRNECLAVKLKVIHYLIDNIEDQNQEETIIEYASAFDFKRSACSNAKRIEYLKKLFSIYGKDYAHEVHKEAKGSLEEYTILICYPARLNGTENQLVAEFNSIWQLMTKSWLKFKEYSHANSYKAFLTAHHWRRCC